MTGPTALHEVAHQVAGAVEQGDECAAELAVYAEQAAQDVARRMLQPEAIDGTCLPAAGAEVACEGVSAVSAGAGLRAERGGRLAANLADVQGAAADDEGVAPRAQPLFGSRRQDTARAEDSEQVGKEEEEEEVRRVVVQRKAFFAGNP